MDPTTRARFLDEVKKNYKKLLVHAFFIVRGTAWGRSRATLEAAAEELLHEAVLRTLDGTRTWDPVTVPDADYFLKEAMRSIANAEATSAERKNASFDEMDETKLEATMGSSPNLEDELAERQERREQQQAAADALLNAAGDDEVLLKVVEALMDGYEKPADIAAQTKLTEKEVYGATRKLRRRLIAAKRKANGHGQR